MKKLLAFSLMLSLVLQAGCSIPSQKLTKTAKKAIKVLHAELYLLNDRSQIKEPTLTDKMKISNTEWCLVHQITSDIYIASLWQKVNSNWEKIAVRAYVDNCDWVQ